MSLIAGQEEIEEREERERPGSDLDVCCCETEPLLTFLFLPVHTFVVFAPVFPVVTLAICQCFCFPDE